MRAGDITASNPTLLPRPLRSISELARASIRSLLPRKAYAMAAHSFDWSCALRALGWTQCLNLWRMRPNHAQSIALQPQPISSLNLSFPFYLREGTSDVDEFIYTVVREAYGKYLPGHKVSYIFDAGANMGDTSAWMLTRFSDARLIAVEPDPDNFAALLRNCEPYGRRFIPVQAGLWPRPARLSLDRSKAKDSIRVLDSADGNCLGVTIHELMEQHNFPRLDIFKCDIEGAELDLFSFDADRWLSATGFIVVETHGPDCLRAVLDSTSSHGFKHRSYRNLHIFERDNWRM
jgi:FkbM family methyltransferase